MKNTSSLHFSLLWVFLTQSRKLRPIAFRIESVHLLDERPQPFVLCTLTWTESDSIASALVIWPKYIRVRPSTYHCWWSFFYVNSIQDWDFSPFFGSRDSYHASPAPHFQRLYFLLSVFRAVQIWDAYWKTKNISTFTKWTVSTICLQWWNSAHDLFQKSHCTTCYLCSVANFSLTCTRHHHHFLQLIWDR